MSGVSLVDVFKARRALAPHLSPTPLLRSRPLSEQLGCELWIKYENCTPIRSFKGRGGIYRLLTLPAEYAGVATASTGNHGQGIALGAQVAGTRAVVVVPEGANPAKVAAIRALGADLREIGTDLSISNEAAKRIAAEENLLYVEDGEDPAVMTGCATLTLEIVEQLPGLDDLVLPVGGGNLIGAAGLVLSGIAPRVRLSGVQSEAAPAVQVSWQAGEPQWVDRCETFAGGLATNYPGHFTFDYFKGCTDLVTLVGEDDLVSAAATMLHATGHLPEGAGAAALAGVLADPGRYAGRTVVILLSGGNIEPLIWNRLGL
ncbi:MAG: pyridoxal-phosphate dependent enzyme [Thermomicrobiales bacterium]|nr:pyridoxal-phosphate dependent enzyme [Thermomicrobiales bacterium]